MRHTLRVLMLTPSAFPEVSGNAVTVERWRGSLVRKGSVVLVVASQHGDARDLLRIIAEFQPDLVHAHHVSRAGSLFVEPLVAAQTARLPLVVSPAGTDVLQSKGYSGETAEVVLRVCHRTDIIVTQARWTAEKLLLLDPALSERIVYVPKSFSWFGTDDFDLRRMFGWTGEHFVFFLPAGIRPVKGNLECLLALEKVFALRSQTRVTFAGPPLDDDYAVRFQEEVERLKKFARWIPIIPPKAMKSAYKASDVVLNGSFSEGFSNAIMEAIAAGRPVLASNIAGNRWPILGREGSPPCGLLFDPTIPGDFVGNALRLIDDGQLRANLKEAAVARATAWPTPEEEADGLLDAYRAAIERRGRGFVL